MSEFVNGYEKMARIGPCVSIFGSARTKSDHKYYKLAEEVAFKISKAGYGVISGGGPGIMEAANKGAHLGGGASDRKSTRLNSSHVRISYAVFCLKKKIERPQVGNPS